jgi:hypothetical protein
VGCTALWTWSRKGCPGPQQRKEFQSLYDMHRLGRSRLRSHLHVSRQQHFHSPTISSIYSTPALFPPRMTISTSLARPSLATSWPQSLASRSWLCLSHVSASHLCMLFGSFFGVAAIAASCAARFAVVSGVDDEAKEYREPSLSVGVVSIDMVRICVNTNTSAIIRRRRCSSIALNAY